MSPSDDAIENMPLVREPNPPRSVERLLRASLPSAGRMADWPNVEAPTTAVGSTDSKSQSTAGGRPKETTIEMPEYDNSNTAVLFKNNQKHGERDPAYKGEIHIGCACGRTYSRRLVAWVKTSTKGTKFMSLSFKPRPGDDIRREAGDENEDASF